MAARGSTVMQFAPSEVYQSVAPPESPAVGQLWRNAGVTPNELLAWTGKGSTNARSYAGLKTGASVTFEDLSDDRKLDVTVKTVATQAGSGTPSPSNVRAISGRSSVKVTRTGKNMLKPGTTTTQSGVTMTVASDGTVTLNGTCTAGAGSPVLFTTLLGFQLNGEVTFSANNTVAYGSDLQMRLMESKSAQVNPPYTNFSVNSVGAKSTFTLNNQYIYGWTIRVGGGVTYNNVVLKPQLEPGPNATGYEPYSGQEFVLTPDAPLYGLTSFEDEIGNDGHVTYRTVPYTLTSITGVNTARRLTNTILAYRPNIGANIVPQSADLICDKAKAAYDWNSLLTVDAEAVFTYNDASGGIGIRLAKSRLSGYSDALTDAQVIALVNAYFSANPYAFVCKRATPTTANVAPVQITGVDGVNVVSSDGASVVVEYTASGWAALGAVQRLAVESVSISPEQGLRVDTVLTSPDGAQQVSTYFNARGTKYGLFKKSDDSMIAGAGVDASGNGYFAANRIMDISASGDMYVRVESETSDDIETISLVFYKGDTAQAKIGIGQKVVGSSDYKLKLGSDDGVDISSDSQVKLQSFEGDIYLFASQLTLDQANIVPTGNGNLTCGASGHGFNYFYGTHTSIQSTSDEREKHDMLPLDPETMRRFIMALDASWYRLNILPDELMAGFKARQYQEAMRIAGIPDDFAGFNGRDPNHLCLDYGQLIAPLVSVVQHQQRRIDDLELRLAALEKRLG